MVQENDQVEDRLQSIHEQNYQVKLKGSLSDLYLEVNSMKSMSVNIKGCHVETSKWISDHLGWKEYHGMKILVSDKIDPDLICIISNGEVVQGIRITL